ncbi:uncharacterized protein LOC122567378 isoform X1 [Bombus pyrosoma]|uniref:uncharacterized protein LOC122567378 isoform X1 n=1 Tax=Bombus pyrosoma TaxID=396416 RepID=UPI001CB8CC2F|nr:uncharacterized protein LOC122567378 isoform X1 [Bombus pyrosoma]
MYGYGRLRLRIVAETAPKGILIKKAVRVTRPYAEKMQMDRLRLAFLADLMNNIRIAIRLHNAGSAGVILSRKWLDLRHLGSVYGLPAPEPRPRIPRKRKDRAVRTGTKMEENKIRWRGSQRQIATKKKI